MRPTTRRRSPASWTSSASRCDAASVALSLTMTLTQTVIFTFKLIQAELLGSKLHLIPIGNLTQCAVSMPTL
jgi:hypothetical protein